MVLEPGEIILWAAIFGVLVGVVWSLKYIVILDRRIERIEEHMENILEHMKKRR